ncbi:MAG: electron transfer flavoprotein beta subunit/FixA family protein, partial [bacterium]
LMQYKKAVTPTELRAANGDHAYEDANQLAEQEQKLRDRGCWIHEWSAEDAGAAPERIGLAGSPTKVKKIESVKLAGNEYKDIPPTKQGVRSLVHELVKEHILS